ncbi:MAG: HD domain-containing protein [Verrucomicrobiales bacterium]|nr:HD domain-containing protein [Verrucomicrobiales bacterium]
MQPPAYAHTLEGKGPEDWEPLEEHLQKVAQQAAQFADAFGAKEWGHLAGLWHDLGKYLPAFHCA